MGVTTLTTPLVSSVPATDIRPHGLWLRNRNWDTLYITLSVFLVPLPYIVYLLGVSVLHVQDDVARNVVNVAIALLIGGPHMYATFMRTALDEQFVKRYPMLIRSSIIIPIVVTGLAFLNLELLLTVFFFWASIHVLHQVTYIVELYNHRRSERILLISRGIDYVLILTCLFPIALYKIHTGAFLVGQNDLGKAIPPFFRQDWTWQLASVVFALAAIAFVVKSIYEYRTKIIHWPKTVFVAITVAVAFSMSGLHNLDTAFQGLNTWHSFQYLMLTIYIVRMRQQNNDLEKSNPMINRLASGSNALKLYAFTFSMVLGSLVLGLVVWIMQGIVQPNRPPDMRFDTAYYTAILCFLWVHYYHDHFLFTDFEALNRAGHVSPVSIGGVSHASHGEAIAGSD